MEITERNSVLVKLKTQSTAMLSAYNVPYPSVGGETWLLGYFAADRKTFFMQHIITKYYNRFGIFNTAWRNAFPDLNVENKTCEFSYLLGNNKLSAATAVWGNGKIRYSSSVEKYIYSDTILDLEEEPEPYWVFPEFPTIEKQTVQLEDVCNTGQKISASISVNAKNFPIWLADDIGRTTPYGKYNSVLTPGKSFILEKDVDEQNQTQTFDTIIHYGNMPLWKKTQDA